MFSLTEGKKLTPALASTPSSFIRFAGTAQPDFYRAWYTTIRRLFCKDPSPEEHVYDLFRPLAKQVVGEIVFFGRTPRPHLSTPLRGQRHTVEAHRS